MEVDGSPPKPGTTPLLALISSWRQILESANYSQHIWRNLTRWRIPVFVFTEVKRRTGTFANVELVSDDCMSICLVNFLGSKQSCTRQIWLSHEQSLHIIQTNCSPALLTSSSKEPKLLWCNMSHWFSKKNTHNDKIVSIFYQVLQKNRTCAFLTDMLTELRSENGQAEEEEKVMEQLWCLSAQVGRAAARQSFELLHHRNAASCWQ